MDIEAHKFRYADAQSVVPTGQFVFQEPRILECIQDSVSTGQEGFWSLLVDTIPYTKALALARGESEQAALGEAKAKYTEALARFDVDGFEAELFWDTHQDEEWIKANPYRDASAEEFVSPDATGGAWSGAYQ